MSETDLIALPNVGRAIARMLARIGIEQPDDLRGRTAAGLYREVWAADGRRPDPCVFDTLAAVIDYVEGGPARPWWHYSRMRLDGRIEVPTP